MKLDHDRTMQLISPRNQQAWAQTYKDRAARLVAEGRMRDAGAEAIARSKASGKWNAMASVDALEEPSELIAALESRDAMDWWQSAAPSYRRNVLRWIASAKRQSTRTKRIDAVADRAGRGEKVPQY